MRQFLQAAFPAITTTIGMVSSKTNGLNGSTKLVPPRAFSADEQLSLDDFAALCEQQITKQSYPLSTSVEKNIPSYDLLSHSLDDATSISRLQDEWNHVLLSGPGVFVVKNLYTSKSLIETVNQVYDKIIAAEASSTKGDHFATSTANSRIWNSFSKHGLADPTTFAEYFSNPWLAHICAAWLGPAYRITTQVNIVRPGGKPQVAHRDYHLGFQTTDAVAAFPRAMHVASQLLTLQGAVAHSEMPLASGPTRFLPFSQQFAPGFVAYRRPEFVEYFDGRWVSLPLETGDGVFFNPALFHAAGENQTADVQRSANLIQVSSAFGKTMETVDSLPLVESCWDAMSSLAKDKGIGDEAKALVAAVSEGYPFPTNLDARPPAPGGMAPESEQDLLMRGLKEGWSTAKVLSELKQMKEDSRA